jgi:hypothetical protein
MTARADGLVPRRIREAGAVPSLQPGRAFRLVGSQTGSGSSVNVSHPHPLNRPQLVAAAVNPDEARNARARSSMPPTFAQPGVTKPIRRAPAQRGIDETFETHAASYRPTTLRAGH